MVGMGLRGRGLRVCGICGYPVPSSSNIALHHWIVCFVASFLSLFFLSSPPLEVGIRVTLFSYTYSFLIGTVETRTLLLYNQSLVCCASWTSSLGGRGSLYSVFAVLFKHRL